MVGFVVDGHIYARAVIQHATYLLNLIKNRTGTELSKKYSASISFPYTDNNLLLGH